MDELEYENIVSAIAFIDAAVCELEQFEQNDVSLELNDIRNGLNELRLARLPHGKFNADTALKGA